MARSLPSRLLLWMVGAGALALACGPHVASNESTANATEAIRPAEPPASHAPLAVSLNVSVTDGVTFTLHVTNTSEKKLELNFPSGQLYDFAVLDTLGREVWRWSEGRLFTQAMQNKLLSSKESAKYEEQWQPPKGEGHYVAVATLRSSNFPVEERIEFTLP